MPAAYFPELYVEIVEYGLDLLQLIESMLSYTRELFDIELNISTDATISLGFFELALVVCDKIWYRT
jgi:hypothetical protein